MPNIRDGLQRSPAGLWMTLAALAVSVCVLYAAWEPGIVVTDGRYDRGANAIWMSHGWLGADAWFLEHNRDTGLYRTLEARAEAAAQMRAYGIRDLYPHLCPCAHTGEIAPEDYVQTEAFLDATQGLRVWPWIGGIVRQHVHLDDGAWRETFVASSVALLERHPRLAGLHVNIEPVADGNADFLLLLASLRAALPQGKQLSVAAFPPLTWWRYRPGEQWGRAYYGQVAEHVDQIVVMSYDTGLQSPKLYRWLLSTWTRQVLTWVPETAVLLGVPAYDDAGVPWHDPRVENVGHALAGIQAGLATFEALPAAYQGVALYSDWEMQPEEWRQFSDAFLATPDEPR